MAQASGEEFQEERDGAAPGRFRRREVDHAAADTLAGTVEIVFRICEAIWYGSP